MWAAAGTLRVVEVTFFGTRGSCPCSGQDYQRYGGNTPSVLVRTGDQLIVLDLGTGLRALGAHVSSDHPAGGPPVKATALLTHLHFDHIIGLPFFGPLRHHDSVFDVYGPRQPEGTLDDALREIVRPPFFPVRLDALLAALRFHDLDDGDHLAIGDAKVRARRIRHPGATLGYRIEADGQSMVYIPDHQQASGDEPDDDGALELCEGADLLVHDAQYTDFELVHKRKWGHSTVDYAVALAARAGVGQLVLFHHDPSHDDEALDRMLERAVALGRPSGLTVSSAAEGVTVVPGVG
jgi:phosphoribosyl 1,2-cyclic phosphodiesterase